MENTSAPATLSAFESLGQKAAELSINDNNQTALPTLDDGEDQKVVDEIESLCMNCHENVAVLVSKPQTFYLYQTGNHSFTTHSNTVLPRDHTHVLFLSSLQL